jgi:hypothetical protein
MAVNLAFDSKLRGQLRNFVRKLEEHSRIVENVHWLAVVSAVMYIWVS